MTVTSALNAMAHAAEGLYAQNRSPISTLMALEGLRAFRDALPRVLDNPADLHARGETLYGAWLCGTVLGTVGMALHHKLCHTLGGSFDLPHAETHSVILPHAIAYNEQAAAGNWRPLPKSSAAPPPARRCMPLPCGCRPPPRCATWACRNPRWTAPPKSRRRTPTGTLAPSRPGRCAACCRKPGPARPPPPDAAWLTSPPTC
jgi:hypothetical protein